MKIFTWIKRIFLSLVLLVLLTILIAVVYEQIVRAQVKRDIPVPGSLVDIGDHKLHAIVKGKGKPVVVFESGLDAGGALVWGKVQDSISKFGSTVSYSRSGILTSERGNNPKTNAAMADELYTLLKKLGKEPPYILIGHSLAGYMLRSFIAQHPTEVAGIIFVDVSHPEQWKRLPKEAADLENPSGFVLNLSNAVGIIRHSTKANTYVTTQSTDSINIIANSYFPVSLSGVYDELTNVLPLAEEAGKITSFGDIPLIVITGTSDERKKEFNNIEVGIKAQQVWQELQKELLNLSTQSEQILTDKSGHYIQLQQPELVIAAVRKLTLKK
jgi:pimeloyl-ACP methyl ester carboxylesterase